MSSLASFLKKIGYGAREAALIGHIQQGAISANGTTQGSGTLIIGSICEVTTTSAGVNDAVTLPLIAKAKALPIIVTNSTANSLNIFPGSGESINSGAANASISVFAGSTATFWPISSSRWLQVS